MREKTKKILVWIKEYMSWIFAAGGLVLSAYGLTNNSRFTHNIIYIVIIIDSLIVLGLGVYIAMAYFHNTKMEEETQRAALSQEKAMEEMKVKLKGQENAFATLSFNDNYIVSTLHKFLHRLYELTDKCLSEIEKIRQEEITMKKHNYSDEEIEEKIVSLAKDKNKEISISLYDDYKRYLSNLLSKTQESIEQYLVTKGFECRVSLTIKQFLEPCGIRDYDISKPCIYTAFRDSRTWGRKIRNEVAQRMYTIGDNSDFSHCLLKGYYIFNNKTRDSKDYSNENIEFDKYYNCGVTTLIFTTDGNQEKKIYGFLACDTLNEKYKNCDIMDQEIAQILNTVAYMIAIYFDNIDFNWDIIQVSPQFGSFWKAVYEEFLVAI